MTSEPRAQFQSARPAASPPCSTPRAPAATAAPSSIVKAGADVNKPNPDGITPLINALDNSASTSRCSCSTRARTRMSWDMSGRTPLYVAVDMNSFSGGGGFGGAGSGGLPGC